ncbi:hypothetical protein KHS38_04395 [Mucilaginibacter sp. Bleaf8]|uniref:hypothetical protein n=1 Tax=Mucilaginibacter sp. Bleaf8 TaxID=2834430 RepID=UPI001BCDC4CE|nr:hypothetical protein [Mucilaginibacter sp. Bleaf8]MBS7563636.1 hypothetical protein [Mucilaginibacter sp. Bleaf8]
MKKIFKTFILALVAAVITSCAVMKANMSQVSIGMSKDEVRQALKIKPDNVISAERLPGTNNLLEIIQYTMYENGTGLRQYCLYFLNGKLDRWNRLEPEVAPTTVVPVAVPAHGR